MCRNRLALRDDPQCYLSTPCQCAYLPSKTAQMLFLPQDLPLSMTTYSHLVTQGFRRSGCLVYRPHCPTCQACTPVRIPVDQFRPDRSQRRNFKRNQDLEVIARNPEFRLEHYQLYLRYLKARHPESSMALASPDDYLNFLTCRWCQTLFYEFRLLNKLIMVTIVDLLDDGLSAVYTFFDPDYAERGFGTYAILWQIEAAKRMRLNWLYLGYWIAACRKMAYKIRFRPQQWYLGIWQPAPI